MAFTLRTPLCSLFGIDHPVLQSGMRNVAGPELVAEVSRAGGLGILAGYGITPDALRSDIRKVRALTDRPFGVNLWMHEALQPPAAPETVPEEAVRAAQSVLNGFRERLGVPEKEPRIDPVPDVLEASFDVVVEEGVPVFSVGLGNPGAERVARCHARGIRVMGMASTLVDARALEGSGVDVVVAQGSEAGGHRSTWVKRPSPQAAAVGTMTLVPELVDALRVPVVAAGGIADGRGLVAALALGAEGVLLGTRFVATVESTAPAFFKDAIVTGDGDRTLVTDVFTGLYARAIENRFTREYAASGAPVLPPFLHRSLAGDVPVAAARRGDPELYPMLAGQSMGIVRDLPHAGDVVRNVVREAERVLATLTG
jgi:nitronate monooxygenase